MRRRFRSVPIVAGTLVLAAFLASACMAGQRDNDAGAAQILVPGGFSGAARTAFDSASAALEAGDAVRARRLFDAVLAEDSTLAAAWIGLHMARRALGDGTGADSALRRARALIEPPRVRGRGAKPVT